MRENIRAADGTWTSFYKRSMRDVPPFIGWNKLLSVVNACNQLPYDIYHKDYCIERDKALFTTLFLTGGRVSEVLALESDNFDYDIHDKHDDYCIVQNMLYLKRFEKTGSYIETLEEEPTGTFARLYEPKLLDNGKQVWKRKRWRTSITSPRIQAKRIRKPFPILKREPLYPILESWVTRNHSSLLFPSPKKRKNGSREMTRYNAWTIIHRLQELTGIEMWPHWFRSQRASQLKNEYGLSKDDLQDWFQWTFDPTIYPKTSPKEMVAKMTGQDMNMSNKKNF